MYKHTASSEVYSYLISNLKGNNKVALRKPNKNNCLPLFHTVSQEWNSHLEFGIPYV